MDCCVHVLKQLSGIVNGIDYNVHVYNPEDR